MKTKIFFSILLLLSVSFAKGQEYTYIPFVEEGKIWSYATVYQVGYLPGGGPEYRAGYSNYQIKGDTIINGLNYKKLYAGCSDKDYYLGVCLREENKKVHFIIEGRDNGQPFFDFNLQEGDWVGYLYQVTKIDTIQIGETKRKRFAFGPGNVYETWIEGIGALEDFYPLNGRLLGLYDQGINYQKKGSDLIYKTEKWYFNENDCDYSDIKSLLSFSPLKLLQRKGEVELQPDAGIFVSGWVYVYSIQGKLLYTKPANINSSIIIPTSGFSNGTYIIQLTEDKTKKTWSGKVII